KELILQQKEEDDEFSYNAELADGFEGIEIPEEFNKLLNAEENSDIKEMLQREIKCFFKAQEAKNGKGEFPDDYKLAIQIACAREIVKGNFYPLPTGFGKSLANRLAVYIKAKNENFRTKNKRGVLVCTAGDDLSERDAKIFAITAGAELLIGGVKQDKQGNRIGYIYDRAKSAIMDLEGPEGEARVYRECDVIFAPIDRYVHRFEEEEGMMSDADKVFMSRQYFMVFDEADEALIYNLMTPFVLSGGAVKNAKQIVQRYITARELAIRLKRQDRFLGRKGILIDRSKAASKKISLSKEGEIALEKLLENKQKLYELTGLNKNAVAWKYLIEQALTAEECFIKDIDYMIKEGEIVIKEGGNEKPGSRWSFGLHPALEAKHLKDGDGVRVNPDAVTRNTMMLTTFLSIQVNGKKFIIDFGGSSGTFDREFMLRVHNKQVCDLPDDDRFLDYISKRIDATYITETEAQKWEAFFEDVAGNIAKKRPVLIKARDSKEVEWLENELRICCNIPDNKKILKYDANSNTLIGDIEENSGKKGAITIISKGERGTDIKTNKAAIELDGLAGYSTYFEELSAKVIQLSGRVARGQDPGSFTFYLSLEDPAVKMYMENQAVSDALSGLRYRLRKDKEKHSIKISHPSLLQQRKDEIKGVITEQDEALDLLEVMRRAIMDSKIQQYEDSQRFEKQVEKTKRAILSLRVLVMAGDFGNKELSKAIPGLSKRITGLKPAEIAGFKKELISKFDDALADFLDTTGKARNSLNIELQDAGWLSVTGQVDAYAPFVEIATRAYKDALSDITNWVMTSAENETAFPEVEGKTFVAEKPVQKHLFKSIWQVLEKYSINYLVGAGIAWFFWLFSKRMLQVLNIMAALAGGTAAAGEQRFVIQAIQGLFTLIPVPAVILPVVWIAISLALIIIGFTVYKIHVKKFSQVYKGQDKIALLFRDSAGFKQDLKESLAVGALGAVIVQSLIMLSSAGFLGALLAVIGAVAFPGVANILLPIAVVAAAGSVLTGSVIAFLSKGLIKASKYTGFREAKLEQTGPFERFLNALFFGLVPVAAVAFLF
ncbi:MAG: hypothetical protein ABIB11_03960, partial [Candidatus Omnitrophota bacterium]